MIRYHHYLHFLKNRELDELYGSMAIKSFALSLVNIFLPIYFLEIGHSFASVFAFYLILNIAQAMFAVPSAQLSSRFGFKHSMLLSVPFFIIFYLLLYALQPDNALLYLLAVILGLSESLFWIGYHTDFSKFSEVKYRGEEVGLANIFSLVFYVAGPVIGGAILVFFGFKVLFLLVSILLFVSVIPLFFSADYNEPVLFSARGIFAGKKLRDYLAFMGRGIDSGVGLVIWPIFIFFLVLKNFELLGIAVSLSLFFSLLSAFFIGRLSDIWRGAILKIGALFNAVLWLIKTLVRTVAQVFAVEVFHGIISMAVSIPFDALSYDKANEGRIIEFVVFREIAIQTGRIVLFAAMIPAADLATGLLFGSGASFLYLFF